MLLNIGVSNINFLARATWKYLPFWSKDAYFFLHNSLSLPRVNMFRCMHKAYIINTLNFNYQRIVHFGKFTHTLDPSEMYLGSKPGQFLLTRKPFFFRPKKKKKKIIQYIYIVYRWSFIYLNIVYFSVYLVLYLSSIIILNTYIMFEFLQKYKTQLFHINLKVSAWVRVKYTAHIIIVKLLVAMGVRQGDPQPKFGNPLWYMVAGNVQFIYRYLALVTGVPVRWNFNYLVLISWATLLPYMFGKIINNFFSQIFTLLSNYFEFLNQRQRYYGRVTLSFFILYALLTWLKCVLLVSWHLWWSSLVVYLNKYLYKKTIKPSRVHALLSSVLLPLRNIMIRRKLKSTTFNTFQVNKLYYLFLVKISVVVIVSAIIIFFGLYTSLYLNSLKQVGFWFICTNLFLWLFSTFNFFIKRNRFGKFTGAVQRFWKRANASFWIIELCLFVLGFYYFLNASQEPLFMYDTAALQLQHFINPTSSYWSLFLLGLVVYVGHILLLYTTRITYRQQAVALLLIIGLVVTLLSVESYQFYYLISSTLETKLVFDSDAGVWTLDWESERLRTKYYYFNFCLILKYWHFVFMSLSWVFFVVKSFELKRIRYAILGFNIQNTLIVYFLSLAYQVYWLKWSAIKYLDKIFYYFSADLDSFSFSDFINEVALLLL